MGILNITPDSFSDGGKYYDEKLKINKVISDARQMESAGADFIDIGGESTRPGSESVSVEEELKRVIPVVSILKKKLKIPISVDTYKSEVAEESLRAGAVIINDISGLRFDKKLPEIISRHNASCIIMHIKGTPKNMQINPEYNDVIEEVYKYLSDSIAIAKDAGIKQMITDTGIGFGKTVEHNIKLLTNLKKFKTLGFPVLTGVSRKSIIDKIYPANAGERLPGTIALNTYAILNGTNIIRVHDVKENMQAVKIIDKIIHEL